MENKGTGCVEQRQKKQGVKIGIIGQVTFELSPEEDEEFSSSFIWGKNILSRGNNL